MLLYNYRVTNNICINALSFWHTLNKLKTWELCSQLSVNKTKTEVPKNGKADYDRQNNY